MNYLQKENESLFEWKMRVCIMKLNKEIDIDWSELVNILNLDCSPDHLRKLAYGYKECWEYIQENNLGNISEEEILQKLILQEQELKKERFKLQTEKSELIKRLREQSRVELWEEKVVEIVSTMEKLQIPEYKTNIDALTSNKRGITGIADSHFGKLIDIKGLMGETINYYDDKVFEQRMWLLLEKLIKIIQKEELEKLYFYFLGDLIDGILRMSQLQSLQYGIVDSVMKFSEFMANWLNELSKNVYVETYSVLGNHSECRPLGSKSGEFPNENAERIIMWYLQARLKDNNNIKINNPNKITLSNVFGLNIVSIHGQDEKDLENSIKDYKMMYGVNIDILLSGHLHSNHSKSVGIGEFGNIEFIQFPSLCGIDEYSMKLKKSSMAGSKVIIIEEGNKDRMIYDLVLQ